MPRCVLFCLGLVLLASCGTSPSNLAIAPPKREDVIINQVSARQVITTAKQLLNTDVATAFLSTNDLFRCPPVTFTGTLPDLRLCLNPKTIIISENLAASWKGSAPPVIRFMLAEEVAMTASETPFQTACMAGFVLGQLPDYSPDQLPLVKEYFLKRQQTEELVTAATTGTLYGTRKRPASLCLSDPLGTTGSDTRLSE